MNTKYKLFVLDTNILMSYPDSILGFDDNLVIITGTTLQELDKLKTYAGETGYNARQAIHTLRSLIKYVPNDQLNKGVKLENGGLLMIENNADVTLLPEAYSPSSPDNVIIATCLLLQKTLSSDFEIILVTNDLSMQINAKACNVNVQDYHNVRVEEESYLGWTKVSVPGSFIDTFYKERKIPLSRLTTTMEDMRQYDETLTEETWFENEYVLLSAIDWDGKTALAKIRNDKLILLNTERRMPFNIKPRNVVQQFALDALMAPVEEVPLVILKGAAGTAKTFLSLAAGLSDQMDDTYQKVLISRNNAIPESEDLGFLPGALDEKMAPLLMPFMDNLETILRQDTDEAQDDITMQIDDLFTSGAIDICPFAYIRGRSIPHAYIICDEIQNCTQTQILSMLTRVAEGTKIILCGDPEQIDVSRLDKHNNGLSFAWERMKGSPLCAEIAFTEDECVRSDLAKEAAVRLTNGRMK